MKIDKAKLRRSLARLGYTKAAVDLDRWGFTPAHFLRVIDAFVKVDKKGRQVLWIREGERYRRTVLY